MITESLFKSNHIKGSHGFGGIWGSNYSTYHHNLIAHHSSRNPRFASGAGYNDYRNNVIYNWGYNSCYGGEYDHPTIKNTFGSFHVNMVGNYYKYGPATARGEIQHRIAGSSYRNSIDNYGKWYVADNYVYGNQKVTKDNWDGGIQVTGGEEHITALKMQAPWEAMKIKEEAPDVAYRNVLRHAGASLPRRDAVDARIISEVSSGTATYGGKGFEAKHLQESGMPSGIIDSQEDVGGWPVLNSLPAPKDTDHDGMPDEWEKQQGLNPNNPSDRNGVTTDGYTNLEVYLNSIG